MLLAVSVQRIISQISNAINLSLIDGPRKVPAPVMARAGTKHLDLLPAENCQMPLSLSWHLVLQVLTHQPQAIVLRRSVKFDEPPAL